MASPSNTPSILSLPPELRLRIYTYIFQDLTYRRPYWKSLKRQFQPSLNTLSLCHQVRNEALPIFRNNLTIEKWFPCPDDPPFIIENATRFIFPALDLQNLRYIIACLPRIRYLKVKATTLVPSDSGPIRDRDHLIARLRGGDDAIFLSKLVMNLEYRDLRTPLWNFSGEVCEIRFVHEVQWGKGVVSGGLNFVDRYRFKFLEVDPFQQTIERFFHYDDRYIPAKNMLLLNDGLSFPLLLDRDKDVVIYVADGHASRLQYNMELANQETFQKTMEKAIPCG